MWDAPARSAQNGEFWGKGFVGHGDFLCGSLSCYHGPWRRQFVFPENQKAALRRRARH